MASRRRRWMRWAGLVGTLAVIVAAVLVVLGTRKVGDVSHPDVEFEQTHTQQTTVAPEQEAPTAGHPSDDGFAWPIYGFTKERTHYLPLKTSFRPPFRHAWSVRGRVLLEFTPVLCGRSLYLLKNNGALYKVSRWTGKVDWKLKVGRLAASSPACDGSRVYVVLLQGKSTKNGRVVAVTQRSGKVAWSRDLPSRSESSPLLDGGRLYFGSENGTVYALRTSDGAVRWTYRASGAVKGALALDRGRLFFGDYGGDVQAVRQADGAKLWKVNASGARAFGRGGGRFYSSPAVEYGRVYIGSTNGAVYSFAARNGKLAWRKQTGAYVYASPAVGAAPDGEPTVWIGSYSGTFYALDARSGSVRWSRDLGGKISGSASVIGDLVFVSSIGLKTTWALGAGQGDTIWKTRRGAFNPVISDGRRIYFNGYSSLFGLDASGVHYASRQPTGLEAEKRQRSLNRRVARHQRYLRRKAQRHHRYLSRLCPRILRETKGAAARRDRRLRAHDCFNYWQWVSDERARLARERKRR